MTNAERITDLLKQWRPVFGNERDRHIADLARVLEEARRDAETALKKSKNKKRSRYDEELERLEAGIVVELERLLL